MIFIRIACKVLNKFLKFLQYLLGVFSAVIRNFEKIYKSISDLMMAVSVERDAGKSKNKLKKISRQFGYALPSSVDSLVDVIYETREVSPGDAGTIYLYLCYKEFGLIN